VVQKQAVQVPKSEVEKTKNTVTTTTIRSGS
jgi:general secretion pathway protein D